MFGRVLKRRIRLVEPCTEGENYRKAAVINLNCNRRLGELHVLETIDIQSVSPHGNLQSYEVFQKIVACINCTYCCIEVEILRVLP